MIGYDPRRAAGFSPRGLPFSTAFILLLLIRTGVAQHPSRADAIRQAAARVAPCVVTIETVGGTQPVTAGRGGGPGAAMPNFVVADGPTTGLIFSADGLILTSSFNFVRDPSVITVLLPDGRRFVAELLARDEVRRLAMLRINASNLPTPEWTDLERVRVGEWAISLGRGHGPNTGPAAQSTAGCTVTVGIISGLKRISGLAIQTDAKLSPANFGGPLIDLDGRVIGLSVPISQAGGRLSGVEWYDSGIGFAIPRAQVDRTARDLAAGHTVRRGLLGVALDLSNPKTIVVVGIGDPSPAARAGLRLGDRITGIDDRPVENYLDLRVALRAKSAGDQANLRVRRKDENLSLPLVLAVPEDIGPVPPNTAPPPRPPGEDDDHPQPPPATGPS